MTDTTARKRTTATTVKGIAATAAGIAVLLGGVGTFALWNYEKELGTDASATGTLEVTSFGDLQWRDVTRGNDTAIDPGQFRMVPADTLEGTSDITVRTWGDNLVVRAEVTSEDGALPEGVSAEVTLTDEDGDEVDELVGPAGSVADGETHDLVATVTLSFDEDATGSKLQPIDLTTVKVDLTQVID